MNSNYEYFAPYGLNIWNAYKNINSEKYYSMTHWKNNNVVEFRIFPSKNDLKLLLSYTQDAINVFKTLIQGYLDNPEKTLMNLQKTYLNYKYELTIPIQEYSGPFIEFYDFLPIISAELKNIFYKTKTSFFFFEDTEFKKYISGEGEGYQTILKYKLSGGLIKYYSYKYYMDYEWNITINNPIELSQEEYNDLYSKFRKSKAYTQWVY